MKHAVKVGLVTLIGLGLLTSLLVWKSGITASIQGFEITGSFQNTNGLIEGAEVRYRGFRIGSVSKIHPRAEDILVKVRVNKSIAIPAESILRVEFDGLIGEKYIGVIPGPDTSKLYQPGSILAGRSSAGIVDFVDVGTQNLDETKKILALFYKMLEDGQIQDSVRNILSNVEVTTAELNQLIPSLQAIAINLNTLTESISPIVGDKEVHQSLKETIASIKDFSNGLGKLGKGKAPENINLLIENMNKTVKELNAIMGDKSFKDDMQSTIRATGKLADRISSIGINDLQVQGGADYYADPKKWGYRAGLNLGTKDNYLLIQGKNLNEPNLTDIIKGYSLNSVVGVHGGMINKKPGLGVDVSPISPVKLSASLYDLDETQAKVSTEVRLNKNIKLVGEGSDLLRNKENFSVGIQLNN